MPEALCVRCRYAGENKPDFAATDSDGRPLLSSPAEDALAEFDGTPVKPVDVEEQIEEILDRATLQRNPRSFTVERLADLVKVESYRRAAEMMRDTSLLLKGTAAGEALLRILHGDVESLEAAAVRCGKSKVAVFKAAQRLSGRLTKRVPLNRE